jgi:hypothetical protein
MGDVTSIKMVPTLVDADGKLTLTLTAIDQFSWVRALVFKDGEALEIQFNDGSKTIDSSCIVQLLNVDRPLSGDVNFTLRLLKDFEASGGTMVSQASPLIYPPNLDLWVPMEKGEKSWPQNYMNLSVQDTVKFMEAIFDDKSMSYTYIQRQSIQALVVDANEGYKYPDIKDPYFNWAVNTSGSMRYALKGAIYELGLRNSNGVWRGQKSYGRPAGGTALDSLNGLPVFVQQGNVGELKILMGNLSGLSIPPDYTAAANWFTPMEVNSWVRETFVLRFARNSYDYNQTPYDSGSGVIGFRFERANNDDNGPYYLKNGKMDYGDIYISQVPQTWKLPMLNTKGYGTDTVYANNQRVTVLDNRHIKIIDNNPVSWAGERYYNFNGVLVPYDTATPVGVNEQPVEIYHPRIMVYPNPIADGVMNIKLDKPAGKDVKLYLYTPLGQKVEEIPIRAGEQEGRIYLEGLATGTYWLKEERYGLPVVIINK